MNLKLRMASYDEVINLATQGLERNAADTSCFVSRAEAMFLRGDDEDDKEILHDLTLAQAKNCRDYNIYRLRGDLHQRQARQVGGQTGQHHALQLAIDAYEEGLSNIPSRFQAPLLAAQSRVFLQLGRFETAIKTAQDAVRHSPGHVSNHLALAFARLAAGHWHASAQAADHGLPSAGWGGRIWLTAISVFANTCRGGDPMTLQEKCIMLSREMGSGGRHLELSESWGVVRRVLIERQSKASKSGQALVRDTIALLEHSISPEAYHRAWISTDSSNESGPRNRDNLDEP